MTNWKLLPYSQTHLPMNQKSSPSNEKSAIRDWQDRSFVRAKIVVLIKSGDDHTPWSPLVSAMPLHRKLCKFIKLAKRMLATNKLAKLPKVLGRDLAISIPRGPRNSLLENSKNLTKNLTYFLP